MRRFKFVRLIAFVLVFSMIMPLSVSAVSAQTWGSLAEFLSSWGIGSDLSGLLSTTDSVSSSRIFHLDCGRKYFTPGWIKSLISELSAAGYTQLQLAFGNDGLRFILDDMSLTGYSSDDVTAAVKSGNIAYNGDESYLTQTEMDDIISFAAANGIEIVPHLNMPGHMDAVLTAMTELGITDAHFIGDVESDRSLNLESAAAVSFAKALSQKYINYFASKGSAYFHIGADEYGNDAYNNNMGFTVMGSNLYSLFADFVNSMASAVTDAGMTPRAWNDGIYYGNYSAAFNPSIQVTYWSNGWSGYNVASPATLTSLGIDLINTNGDFYYVLGKNDNFDTGYSYAANFANTSFIDNNYVAAPVGSMFCVWCDSPDAETETEIAAKIRMPLRAMAARMQDKTIDTVTDAVVFGGFNADGTLNTSKSDPDTDNDVNVYADGLTEVSYSVYNGNISVNGASAVLAYDITPLTADGPYTGSATVSVKIPQTWDVSKVHAFIVNTDNTVTVLDGAAAAGIYTFTAPHFSVMGLFETGETDPEPIVTEDINLSIGETKTVTQENVNNSAYVDRTNLNVNIAAVGVTGVDEVIGSTTTTYEEVEDVTVNNLISSNSSSWQICIGYFYTPDNGQNYYQLYAKRTGFSRYTYTWGYATGDQPTQIGTQKNVKTGTAPNISVYSEKTIELPPVAASTSITFTGISAGVTEITVGSVRYIITVAVEPLTIEYWITNARPTVSNTDINNSYVINTYDEGVSTEAGVLIASLVSATAYKDGRTLEYWQSRMLDVTKDNASSSGTELQTEKSGDDETRNGVAFERVRFWDGVWQLFTTEWVTVDCTLTTVNYTITSGSSSTNQTYSGNRNQVVAYYMEVVNINNVDNNSELHVNAADWGTKGDGTGDWGYTPESNRCSVSIQLVYEDGSLNPAATDAGNLKSKTILYGYWAGGRGLGTMVFTGESNYQIYKVTAETGDMTSITAGTTVTVTDFEWDNNEETVWEGNATQSVAVSNSPRSPSYESPYDNLAWNTDSNNRNNAILIRVYVRTVQSDSNINVYYREGNPQDFVPIYDYGINVSEAYTPNNFSSFATTGSYAGKDLALINNTVTNALGVIQTVSSNISGMPEIGGRYMNGYYLFSEMEKSDDNKSLYLYFLPTDVSKNFVADFGIPLVITTDDIGFISSSDIRNVTMNTGHSELTGTAEGQYGIFAMSPMGGNLTYTLKSGKLLEGVDTVKVTVNYDTGEPAQYQINIIPATNVLYEENNYSYDSKWEISGTPVSASQSSLNELYGYDAAYDNVYTYSMGSALTATVDSSCVTPAACPTATFTFTGTGFDVISECGLNTASLYVRYVGASGSARGVIIADTYFNGAFTSESEENGTVNLGTAYQIPVVSKDDLPYDTYTVTVYGYWLDTDASTAPAKAPASRAASTYSAAPAMSGRSLLSALLEAMGDYGINLRDVELVELNDNAEAETYDVSLFGATASSSAAAPYALMNDSKYVSLDGFRVYNPLGYILGSSSIAYQQYEAAGELMPEYIALYDNLSSWYDVSAPQNSSYIYIESGSTADSPYSIADYKISGPQNEIYLVPGSAIAFTVNAGTVMVSAKTINGATSLAFGTGASDNVAVNSYTEMYYSIRPVDSDTGLYIIKNTGNAILSLVNLKVIGGDVAVMSADYVVSYIAPVMLDYAELITSATFVPEHFNTTYNVTKLGIIVKVTLSVEASKDVAYITVNGERYDARKTIFNRSDYNTYTVTFRTNYNKLNGADTVDFVIVAYNADGANSSSTVLNVPVTK